MGRLLSYHAHRPAVPIDLSLEAMLTAAANAALYTLRPAS